jgi:Zn finger protein HypA/HybF involved in hydrogenase expression
MKIQILDLLKQGKTYAEIVAILGCSKATISYHVKRLGQGFELKRYDWKKISQYYDQGHSLEECMTKFGFSRGAWHGAVVRGDIKVRNNIMDLDVLLVDNRPQTSRSHLKRRLIREHRLEAKCNECGIADWNNKPLSLQLDHINGQAKDNRLENLRLLCPNCHSQTETFAGRNCRRNIAESAKVVNLALNEN